MDEDFFDYLVATNQVDNILGYKNSDIVKALCLCAEDILNNNLTHINEITNIKINEIFDNRYEITGYLIEGKIKKQFAIRFDFTGSGYQNEEIVLFE